MPIFFITTSKTVHCSINENKNIFSWKVHQLTKKYSTDNEMKNKKKRKQIEPICVVAKSYALKSVMFHSICFCRHLKNVGWTIKYLFWKIRKTWYEKSDDWNALHTQKGPRRSQFRKKKKYDYVPYEICNLSREW